MTGAGQAFVRLPEGFFHIKEWPELHTLCRR